MLDYPKSPFPLLADVAPCKMGNDCFGSPFGDIERVVSERITLERRKIQKTHEFVSKSDFSKGLSLDLW